MADDTRHIHTEGGDYAEGTVDKRIQAPTATGGSVTLNLHALADAELPPELQNVTLRQMILGVIASIQSLEDRVYYARKEDQTERREHWADMDQRMDRVDERIDRMETRLDRLDARIDWTLVLIVVVVLCILLLAYALRVGWL